MKNISETKAVKAKKEKMEMEKELENTYEEWKNI